MSQNDFTLANQSFPAFRADLNSALQALATNNSGGSAPSTTFANMWWYDTSNNIMYIRNEDNDAWIKFAELDQANDKFVLSGTLQLDDGTVSAPALTFNSDTNMGIYRGGTDILKFVTAGTDAVTIDANQRLGIGLSSNIDRKLHVEVDNTYAAKFGGTAGGDFAIEIGQSGTSSSAGFNATGVGGSMIFSISGQRAMAITSNGDFQLYEDTGTTPKLFWDSSFEYLGLGTASPTSNLHVSGANGGLLVDMQNPVGNHGLRVRSGNNELNNGTELVLDVRSGTSNNPLLNVHAGGNVGIGTASPTNALHVKGATTVAYIESTGVNGDIQLDASGTTGYTAIRANNNDLAFLSNTTEACRIDSNQNLLVGTTTVNPADNNDGSGSQLSSAGSIQTSVSNATPAIFNRGNDGGIIALLRAGVSVGSIGTVSSRLHIENGDTGLRIAGDLDQIFPCGSGGSDRDNAIDLGSSGVRFKDLYLSGGVYLGGTGSANYLDDYEEGFYNGTITPSSSGSVAMNGGADAIGYTKVGRMVTIQGDFRISSVSSPVGNSRISLPFVVSDMQDLAGRGGTVLLVFTGSVWEQHIATTNENTSYLEVQITPATGYEYRFFFTYFTN